MMFESLSKATTRTIFAEGNYPPEVARAGGKMYTGNEGVSKMTTAEKEKKYALMFQAMDALMADDWDRMLELNSQIIMEPEAAMQSFRAMGKERFLESGFNLSAADEAFGEGWLDKEPLPRKYC